eukprot:13026-Heterococcus_DN1.PRE.2
MASQTLYRLLQPQSSLQSKESRRMVRLGHQEICCVHVQGAAAAVAAVATCVYVTIAELS